MSTRVKGRSFDIPLQLSESITFDSESYCDEIDYKPLRGQLALIFALIKDGEYRTLADIVDECGGRIKSTAARLRDLRKPEYGSYIVDKKLVEGKKTTWEYAIKIEIGSGRTK